MATTALTRTVSNTYVLEAPRRDRRVTGTEWQQVAVLTPTLNQAQAHFPQFAVMFSGYAEAGLVAEVRIKTSTGITSNPALVVGQLDNCLLGFITSATKPEYVFVEARGAVGSPLGVHVTKCTLLELEGNPSNLDIGPHYPPGYSPVQAGADIAINTITAVDVEQGQQGIITVPYINNGPDVADTFDVVLPIPTGATFNAGASTAGCTVTGPNIVCPVSAGLAATASGSVVVAFDVAGAATTGTQTLQASVQNQIAADPVVANDTRNFDFIISPPPTADVGITSVSSPNVDQGTTGTVTVNYINNGPDTSGNFTVVVPIPTDATFNAGASTAGCTVNGGNVECVVSPISNAASGSVVVAFDVAGAATTGPQNLNASITSQTITDPNAGNNISGFTFNITSPGAGASPTVIATDTANQPSSTTTHTVDVPAGLQPNDLILIFTMMRHDAAVTGNNGLITLSTDTPVTTRSLTMIGKIAAGTETTFDLTSTISTNSASIICIVRDFHGSLTEGTGWARGAASDGGGAFIDPLSVTAPWGALNNLYFAVFGAENDDATVTAYPANWTHSQDFEVSGGGLNSGCTIGVASRQLATASADPGAFNLSESEGYVTRSFVFRPT